MKRIIIVLAMFALASPAVGAESKGSAPTPPPISILTPQPNERSITHEDAVAMMKTMKEINANLTAIHESIRRLSGESR